MAGNLTASRTLKSAFISCWKICQRFNRFPHASVSTNLHFK